MRRPDLLKHRSLTIEGASPTGHEQHVARTFALSYEQLHPTDGIDAMALVTLARAAWFAPGEPIPRELLRASVGVDDTDEAAVLQFEDGLTRLRELGLITEQEDGAPALHRLLAAFVRSEAGDAETHVGRSRRRYWPRRHRLNQAGYPAPLLAWQPQLRFVAERASEKDSEHAADLLNELGYHLNEMADFAGARAACERALKIDEASFGPDHPKVAIRVNNLGSGAAGPGRSWRAPRRPVSGRLRSTRPASAPTTQRRDRGSTTWGLVLRDLGELAGAKAAFERALSDRRRRLRPRPPQCRHRCQQPGLGAAGPGRSGGSQGRPSSGR